MDHRGSQQHITKSKQKKKRITGSGYGSLHEELLRGQVLAAVVLEGDLVFGRNREAEAEAEEREALSAELLLVQLQRPAVDVQVDEDAAGRCELHLHVYRAHIRHTDRERERYSGEGSSWGLLTVVSCGTERPRHVMSATMKSSIIFQLTRFQLKLNSCVR